jgi:hypothetical protein
MESCDGIVRNAEKWSVGLNSTDPGLEIVNPHAAGIDVGNESHYVAVPPGRDAQPVREFGSWTAALEEMAQWLKSCGVAWAAPVVWLPVIGTLSRYCTWHQETLELMEPSPTPRAENETSKSPQLQRATFTLLPSSDFHHIKQGSEMAEPRKDWGENDVSLTDVVSNVAEKVADSMSDALHPLVERYAQMFAQGARTPVLRRPSDIGAIGRRVFPIARRHSPRSVVHPGRLGQAADRQPSHDEQTPCFRPRFT